MKYDIDFFIDKFTKIPDNEWTTKTYNNKLQYCAMGHCGASNKGFGGEQPRALHQILGGNTIDINDGLGRYKSLGKTPKTRILKALNNVKNFGQIIKQ